jgi:hypothetical protein
VLDHEPRPVSAAMNIAFAEHHISDIDDRTHDLVGTVTRYVRALLHAQPEYPVRVELRKQPKHSIMISHSVRGAYVIDPTCGNFADVNMLLWNDVSEVFDCDVGSIIMQYLERGFQLRYTRWFDGSMFMYADCVPCRSEYKPVRLEDIM